MTNHNPTTFRLKSSTPQHEGANKIEANLIAPSYLGCQKTLLKETVDVRNNHKRLRGKELGIFRAGGYDEQEMSGARRLR